MIRTMSAAAALAFSMGSAHATNIYMTSNSSAEAPGTPASGGANTNGGLCTVGNAGCIQSGTNTPVGLTNGVAGIPNGLIAISVNGQPGPVALHLAFAGAGNTTSFYKGAIWDVAQYINGSYTDLGTTAIVAIGTAGNGSVYTNIVGNGTYYFAVTDLLEQYVGVADTLPQYLKPSLGTSLNSGTVGTGFNNSEFSITQSYGPPIPEPASMTLCLGGIVMLGALRRRRRTN